MIVYHVTKPGGSRVNLVVVFFQATHFLGLLRCLFVIFSSFVVVCLVASAYFNFPITFFALYEATPVKFTFTAFHPAFFCGGVTTVAAHSIATLRSVSILK
jgi:hypothetical protein